jgi:translation initiation factor 2 subunit 2
METDYEKLLEKARRNLPKSRLEAERFEIPKVIGHLQGNRTIISNFFQIADMFGREPEHLLKFVLKELAAPGELKKSGSLIIGTKIAASRINEKLKKYAEEYVICKECGKPDTKVEEENGVHYVRCTACGARRPIKYKI